MNPAVSRALKYVVVPVVVGHLVARLLTGCGGLRGFDEVNDPKDDVALATCRKEMRAAREAGAPPPEAYGVYYRCTADAGLR